MAVLFLMLIVVLCCVFFFFFQAEDGIRYLTVTGVQTCALPISYTPGTRGRWRRCVGYRGRTAVGQENAAVRECMGAGGEGCGRGSDVPARRARSEERRGGKEWRSRWSPDH